jgi:hypothetical protein
MKQRKLGFDATFAALEVGNRDGPTAGNKSPALADDASVIAAPPLRAPPAAQAPAKIAATSAYPRPE